MNRTFANTDSVGTQQAADLGPMPLWNLADLYPSPHSKELEHDLTTAAAQAKAIAERYKGKLVALGKDGAALAVAIKSVEALSDTMGKLGSYAGLLYAANTTDPDNAKFYGDIQDKLTTISTDLIFFERKSQHRFPPTGTAVAEMSDPPRLLSGCIACASTRAVVSPHGGGPHAGM